MRDLRRVLLSHSDHRACRAAWAHYTGGTAEIADLVESLRVTRGELALLGSDGAADVYTRWHAGGFELLTVSPPWTVETERYSDPAELFEYLDRLDDLRLVHHDETPFVQPGPEEPTPAVEPVEEAEEPADDADDEDEEEEEEEEEEE
ncbi:hypothetical protein [Natronomonas sp. EA1]|uniref:hypothetical protein n=1 Tax=Natronomonas sp. EA1 TaxID=3421655 RepID=UPI003EBE7A3D